MRDRRLGAVLVTEGDRRLVGIFTGRDAVHRVLAEGKSADRTTLAEVMTCDPDTMPPGKMMIEALRLMEDGRYRHLPIVDDGKVVVIVSRSTLAALNSIGSMRRPASGSEFDLSAPASSLWLCIGCGAD
jgi:CBS domain-containing protein